MTNDEVFTIAEKIMELSFHEVPGMVPYTVKRQNPAALLPFETFTELSRFDYIAAIILSEFSTWDSGDIAEWIGGQQIKYINSDEYRSTVGVYQPSEAK